MATYASVMTSYDASNAIERHDILRTTYFNCASLHQAAVRHRNQALAEKMRLEQLLPRLRQTRENVSIVAEIQHHVSVILNAFEAIGYGEVQSDIPRYAIANRDYGEVELRHAMIRAKTADIKLREFLALVGPLLSRITANILPLENR